MESLLAIQVHRCFLRKSQKSMLVVFPRENAAVLSYTTATMTRGTSNSNNNKNNNFGTFSTNVTAFFCVNGLKNYQCT